MAIMFVREGNRDHLLIYITKVVEGVASSFIAPCVAALTLANFGPSKFDSIMASNVLWGHIGSAISAILAGAVSYIFYPNIKSCFFVIGFSAFCAIMWIPFLPEGNPLLGRGFHTGDDNLEEQSSMDGYLLKRVSTGPVTSGPGRIIPYPRPKKEKEDHNAAGYMTVLMEPKTLTLCLTGFFFHFANANVLLVLGELMGGENDEGDGQSRNAIPLIAGAILLAQVTMSAATLIADNLTEKGVGRKVLFQSGLCTLPLRCALILWWKNAGDLYLLSTQIFDGLGGGFFGLLHPYIVADITFGTGRFNLIMGLTASSFGLGATMSNFLGQLVVEHFGHEWSLTGSLILSFIPIIIFQLFMPETMNERCKDISSDSKSCSVSEPEPTTSYKNMC
eukprot:CAMPEP_0178946760 /NCGR_PEP_ID=MMETSP0789-20121207/4464_1 /TAXON_ID=3005 /ORGANISM="Rhizosolenia setigera, Strain CCMP 1694" /LENGTH=390 /DNA_ID=CAMNT_0020626787 /DNA_START=271 /DNA_END=1443 /DNA_ORIENTATION=+